MTATAWAHLPNAKHINRILSDLTANPDKWNVTSDAAYDAAYVAAYDAAYVAAYDAVGIICGNILYVAAYDAASDAASDAAYVAHEAILALIAYDDCAYLLNEKPEDVKMMALLGNQKAILLYPACVALQKEQKWQTD